MTITQKISLDMVRQGITPRIVVKQGDANSRAVEITLLENGQDWEIPAGASAAVRYRKTDGTSGMYDTMPDGTAAVTCAGNVMTVNLAPQMLTCPGPVKADVVLTSGTSFLATFDFQAEVARSPVDKATLESQNYYKVASLEQINAALEALNQKILTLTVQELGPVDATLTETGLPADAAATGNALRALSARVAGLQALLESGGNNVADYVIVEAARTASAVAALQSGSTVTFAAISDAHVQEAGSYAAQTQESLLHAGQALGKILAAVDCDFVVNLGDNIWGDEASAAAAQAEHDRVNSALDVYSGYSRFDCVGNHDANTGAAMLTTQQIYNSMGSHNDYDETGATVIRGYGYKDFPGHKLRVIVLNTSDYLDLKGGYGISDEQKAWFMSALDLSRKADYTDWSILILSHIPLDFPTSDYDTHTDMPAILYAYQHGTTVSIGAGSYDYSACNGAAIIGNIHGHTHSFAVGKIGASDYYRVATPCACFYRTNETETAYMDDVSYNKEADSAGDTSLVVYTIDLDKKLIHATHYGAGIDRQIAYAVAATVAVSGISLSQSSAEIDAGSTLTLTAAVLPTNATNKAVIWTSDNPAVASVTDGVVTGISGGTANITATTEDGGLAASCTIAVTAVSYTNRFNPAAEGFADSTRFSSNGSTADSTCYISNYIAAVTGDTVRVRCPSGTYDSGIGYNQRCIVLYDSGRSYIEDYYISTSNAQMSADSDGKGFAFTISTPNVAYVRVSGNPAGNYGSFVVTVNEEIS